MRKSHKDKPLPKPPTTAFGRKKGFEQPEDAGNLTADRMAQAMAEGKLDEFLKEEMPDNEYARNLANMMMGMTGMMPGPGMAMPPSPAAEQSPPSPQQQETPPAGDVPDDVRQAIMSGDVHNLMEQLRREHVKRNPGAEQSVPSTASSPEPEASTPSQGMPAIDKELIDALVRIAQDNSVTLDWIILRAIKVYVQEYQKTGKL